MFNLKLIHFLKWSHVFYLVVSLFLRIFANEENITLKERLAIYVMELKFGKTAQEALEQIESKHYADAFAMSGKEIIKVGMSFNIKEDNTIVLDWKL